MRTFWSFSGTKKEDRKSKFFQEERQRLLAEEKKAYWDKVKAEEEEFRNKNFPSS